MPGQMPRAELLHYGGRGRELRQHLLPPLYQMRRWRLRHHPDRKQHSLESARTLSAPPQEAGPRATPVLSIPVNGHVLNELVGEVVSQDNAPG